MLDDQDEGTRPGEPSCEGENGTKLMESGSIWLGGNGSGERRVSRGMPAISIHGHAVGWVAALVLDAAGDSTGLVVARPYTALEYYHLPLGLIGSVTSGQVRLRIRAEATAGLPRRNPGWQAGTR